MGGVCGGGTSGVGDGSGVGMGPGGGTGSGGGGIVMERRYPSRRARRPALTAGHSSTSTLNTTVSRKVPSSWRCSRRSTPSRRAESGDRLLRPGVEAGKDPVLPALRTLRAGPWTRPGGGLASGLTRPPHQRRPYSVEPRWTVLVDEVGLQQRRRPDEGCRRPRAAPRTAADRLPHGRRALPPGGTARGRRRPRRSRDVGASRTRPRRSRDPRAAGTAPAGRPPSAGPNGPCGRRAARRSAGPRPRQRRRARCRATTPPVRLRQATSVQPASWIRPASSAWSGHARMDSAR